MTSRDNKCQSTDEWEMVSPVTQKEDDPDAWNELMENKLPPGSTFCTEGICYVLRYPVNKLMEDVSRVARSTCSCNACTSRAKQYVGDAGPDGALFLAGISDSSDFNLTTAGEQEQIVKMRELAMKCCSRGKPVPIVVTDSTYELPQQGRIGDQLFFHWTIRPKNVTAPAEAAHFDSLKHYLSQIDARLIKLTEPEAVLSVKIMEEERPGLARPDHWASVIRWVQTIQAKATKPFEEMTEEEKVELRIFAIMTGRHESSTHKDFHQSSNLVDFLTYGSREALRQEMDTRSDPANYMISQLNRRLNKESVTSPHIIGLTWDGKFTDDLDLHVITPRGKEVCYNRKNADGCRLDFDANVSIGEAEPCENISVVPGKYKICVNNFTRRTHRSPIPFQIVCRSVGQPDQIYEGVWGVNRQKDDKIHVCTHQFWETAKSPEELELSEKASRRALAQAADWDSRVGVPKATIATVESVENRGMLLVSPQRRSSTTPLSPSAVHTANSSGSAVNCSFEQLLVQKSQKKKKQFLSENCRQLPSTFADVVDLIKSGRHTLSVNLRDHAPGYLVDIATNSPDVRKCNLPAPCHYRDKFTPPHEQLEIGNARLDKTWVKVGRENTVSVCAITQLGTSYFLALENAKLPTSEDFPLGSGFYPTDLSVDYHMHRERWTYFHTQLRPSIVTGSRPMIGCFLIGEKATIYLDDTKLTVAV
ncbi:hypothetical protein CYMTET_29043 [Cymbomonas tetramitiformis]|uniref:Uncharacterized protein n=1 Tax=Cymbomonas tetramitiformis TaxID=36881 RepID=A0AAE0KVL3_9CHLO|nr:hypothetical protein CYMTET_29043 [Cymbomonas tetramitiformis]